MDWEQISPGKAGKRISLATKQSCGSDPSLITFLQVTLVQLFKLSELLPEIEGRYEPYGFGKGDISKCSNIAGCSRAGLSGLFILQSCLLRSRGIDRPCAAGDSSLSP